MAAVGPSEVRKAFGTIHMVIGVDISIENSEFCVLVGPSGELRIAGRVVEE